MHKTIQKQKAMEENKYKAHVVVVPYPSQGQINPLLQFAKSLASKSVKATLATPVYTIKSISAANVSIEAISDGFDEGGFAQAKNEDLFLKSFETNGSRTLSQLIQKFQDTEFPINCVIYDSFLPWALDVAKKHGIFGASFFTNSACVCHIFARIYHGLLPLPIKLEKTPLSVPGLPPLNFPDLPFFIKFPDSYPAYLSMKLRQFSNLEKADWAFANTFEELEGEEARNISEFWPAKLIGPMVPSAYLDGRIKDDNGYGASLWKPVSKDCLNWLETKTPKSVAYVSFGSMVSLTDEQMEEMAWGLKESGFYFLWVVRDSQLGKFPKGFIESISEKGLIVSWCNQLEMLEHKATGCFVTHCGWNSTIEGLSLGVPMVGVPQWADQMPDAKYIEEIWGVGVRAKEDEKGIVRREEVVKSLKEVMEGERSECIKKNAMKWRELAKEAVGKGGSSDKGIDEFIEQLMKARTCGDEKGEGLDGRSN